nr:hypothetical protein [Tanacetum cinerariifolium]
MKDYIPGPKKPEQAPPSPNYVPGPEHANDEIVAEDQPYAKGALPIAQSPEYVQESDFEVHPKDDDDEDSKEDPVDYPAYEGDDGDDEEESSEDDKDDEMDIEADEEEEEHPAPADSIVVAPTATDQALSAEETEPFETDESAATPPPHPAYRMTARIFILAPVPMPAWTDSEGKIPGNYLLDVLGSVVIDNGLRTYRMSSGLVSGGCGSSMVVHDVGGVCHVRSGSVGSTTILDFRNSEVHSVSGQKAGWVFSLCSIIGGGDM